MDNQNEKVQPAAKNPGWLVTAAATCALLALGVLYAWSVIKQNIPDEWGWADWQKALPYSVACVVFSIMTMAGGRLQDKFGPRVVITAGGVLAGLGMIISSLTTSPWMFTFSFGFLLGSGIGFVYGSGTPAAMKWFPAKMTGLISGIVVAGFGMGSAWVAPLAKYLIATQGIQTTLLWLGIGMFVAVVGFAQLLKSPPADFIPGSGKATVSSAAVKKADYTPGEVVKTWQFYVIWLAFAFGAGAGLMIIGNLASIVTRQANLPALSAVAVSVLALGNGGGRVMAGFLSDKFGRKIVLIVAFLFQAVLIILLSNMAGGNALATPGIVLALAVLIGASYGANLSVFPAISKDFFGMKNFGMNYGLVYTAWGLGGFMLSLIAGAINDATQTFTNAYFMAAGLLVIAAVLMTVLKAPQKDSEISVVIPPAQAPVVN
jgi:OFA family oxalate/formate antiporter-like MFS transporter